MGKGTKHARDWNETPLQVLIDARNLYIHSVRIMGNPKHFNPADDFHNETLYLIQRELLHVYVSARAANRINVTKEPWRARERLALQDEALTSCDVLGRLRHQLRVRHGLHPQRKQWTSRPEYDTILIKPETERRPPG